jgi:starch-binding outer membrane protein, SusD/RagB family
MKAYKILFFTLVPILFASCKKLVEVKETDFIGGDVALKTVANNEAEVIGAYVPLTPEMDILFNAVMSDEVKKAEFYNAATVHEWQFSTQDITIRDQFTAINLFYKAIDRANRALQALPNADSTRVGDNTLRLKLKGEALFIRAFAHFEVLRYYSGNYDANALAMPYVEVPSLQPQQRITMQPYFDKLKADLTEAKTLLPASLADVNRANSYAVSGLQARIALYMKDWANAITYSTEYINAIPLASRTNFPGIWTDANNSELAFKLKRTTSSLGPIAVTTTGGLTTTRMGSLFRGTSTATAVGTITWAPSDKLWNSYDQANDIRFPSYFKDEPLLSAAGRPSHLIAKYAGGAYGSSNENVADAKIFRTGEMYLIRSEAKARNNDLTGAAADLNALRAARINGYTNVSFAALNDAITAISTERFKELAYEGHRLWDLRRYDMPVSRLASDAPTSSAVTLPAGNFRFLLPIPFSEIQANPTIQQNPGYQ